MSDLKRATVGQIAITARDKARATAFYRDVLGFDFLFDIPNGSFFDCGGIRLFVDVPEDPLFAHPASVVYFKVEDIQATTATLKSRGVAFYDDPHIIATMPDHELWMAFFHDSEGNILSIMSEVPLAKG